MTAEIRRRGEYELLETTKHHTILVLGGEEPSGEKQWFAWIRGQQSPILVKSDADHQKDHTIARGRFYLVDFHDDPEYRDQPYLFLERDDHFQVIILPNGLPTESDEQKRLVEADEAVSVDKLDRHLRAA